MADNIDTNPPLDFASKSQNNNESTPQISTAKAIKPATTPVFQDKMQQTIGGSDLSVWFFQELPDIDDLAKGLPFSLCKKKILTIEFDSVLSITYSTIREKFPVRSLGWINAKKHTAGIRTISGHIAFGVFTEDVLADLRGRITQEIERQIDAIPAVPLVLKNAQGIIDKQNKDQAATNARNNAIKDLMNREMKAALLDQLAPFHLLVMGTNERGTLSRMLIKDVTIVDENQYQGTQQPNIVNRCSFVCLDIVPMTKHSYDGTLATSSISAIDEAALSGSYTGTDSNSLSGSSLMLDMYYQSLQYNNNTQNYTRG